MATLARKIEAEKRLRDLLEESDLPQPDYVEYDFTCIRFFFCEAKQVVIVDLDSPDSCEPDADMPPSTESPSGPGCAR